MCVCGSCDSGQVGIIQWPSRQVGIIQWPSGQVGIIQWQSGQVGIIQWPSGHTHTHTDTEGRGDRGRESRHELYSRLGPSQGERAASRAVRAACRWLKSMLRHVLMIIYMI